MFHKIKQASKKGRTVPSVNLEKLKVSSRKCCLYRLIKLKRPIRSFRSQSKHLHGWLPKVAELFINTLSEQDVATSNDNDVLIFDSPSAILKMERREDEPKFTAHVQRFFCSAAMLYLDDGIPVNSATFANEETWFELIGAAGRTFSYSWWICWNCRHRTVQRECRRNRKYRAGLYRHVSASNVKFSSFTGSLMH